MKILLAHVVHSPGVDKWYADVARVAGEGLEVNCFCVTLAPPGPRLSWKELDRRWRQKEKGLMEMYARLRDAASECDVLLLYNGANVHPEFLQCLPSFNVYCCFDDPESSANLSAPVAAAFDAVFYGNIASRFQYESWGCKNLSWLPIFTAPADVPPQGEGECLLSAERDVEILFVGEKNTYRQQRLELLASGFPQAMCIGKGWPAGRVDDATMLKLYRRSKIGWNVHNSTGPINRRLFALPAHGVLQICDNKTGLGQIFRLGEEVVGFDTIPEAIELTRHYLNDYKERQRIAANGHSRFWQDYHPAAIWKRIGKQLEEWGAGKSALEPPLALPKRKASDLLRPYGQETMHIAKSLKRGTLQVVRECRKGLKSVVYDRDERAYLEEEVIPYVENPVMKGVNMAKERLAKGEPFEWPNMVALNWAVTALIRDAKYIVDIGSGTGPFAEHAAIDPTREIHCFEEDDFARGWAEKNRAHPNVIYRKNFDPALANGYDLLVSLDVFEHVEDMRDFLSFCCSLAPRAIYSTPNREVVRGPQDMGPPLYPPHVREFAPGEIYWIFKQYYRDVFLYHMPDVYVPWLEPMTILTKGTPIIAECKNPIVKEEGG